MKLLTIKKSDLKGTYKLYFDRRRKTYPITPEEQNHMLLEAINILKAVNLSPERE